MAEVPNSRSVPWRLLLRSGWPSNFRTNSASRSIVMQWSEPPIGLSSPPPKRCLHYHQLSIYMSLSEVAVQEISQAHTHLKRPKMWPIREIKHVSNTNFYSYLFLKGPRRSRTFCLLCNACWYFVYTTPKSDVCQALPCRICRFKLRCSSRCNKTTCICPFPFEGCLME